MKTMTVDFNFPNHLIVFPKWTYQALTSCPDMQIVGKRAADGYLTQILLNNVEGVDLPDFSVCSLDGADRKWVEYRVEQNQVILKVGKDIMSYSPNFIKEKENALTMRLVMSFLRCYSSVEIMSIQGPVRKTSCKGF